MDAETENKNYFYCAITDSLISECDASIGDLSVDNTFRGIYWEAGVYFEHNDFTLSAYKETVDGVKRIEVLKFPTKKISEARILDTSPGKEIKSEFKLSLLIGGGFGIMFFLWMLIHPEQRNFNISTAISISLFFAIGITLGIYLFQTLPGRKKIVEINLITNDNRVITLFAHTAKKEWIKEVLLNNSIKVKA